MGDLTIRCSNCEGLAKEVDSSRPFFTCKFCGAQNRNPLYESRKEQQQRRRAEAMAQQNAVMTQSQQYWSKFRWWWIAMPVVLMIGGAVMSIVVAGSQQRRARRAVTAARRAAPPPKPVRWLWIDSHHAFPLQADGDGVEDVALLAREEVRLRGKVQRKSTFLAVYSGKTFEPLWKVDREQKDRLWRAPGKLILVRAQHLLVYRDKDGELLWKASLPDKIVSLGLVDGQLRVGIKTKDWLGFDIASGKAQGKTKEPHFRLRCDWHFRQRSRDTYRGDIGRAYRRFKGYTVHAAYCPVTKRTKYRKNGRKLYWTDHRTLCRTPYGLVDVSPRKGTRIPSFLGYERKSKKKLWVRRLTPELETFESAPKAALDDEAALVTYKIKEAPRLIELFSLADGKVRWTKAMKKRKWDREPQGLGLGEQRAYVIHGGYRGVQIFDRDSGKVAGWIRGDKR